MEKQKFPVWVLIVVLAVSVIGALAISALSATPRAENGAPGSAVSSTEDAAIRTQVVAFGAQLQQVSLLAPAAIRKAAMDEHYGEYVAPELLSKWYPEGADALGRLTSSPWPDRIDVVEISQEGDSATVEANVIEVANGESGGEDVAGVQPVTLKLEKREGRWLIVDWTEGAFSQLPQRQTLTGTWECLPHKDQSGPQTTECAFGIAIDQSDAHYAVDTNLLATQPVDFPTGTKVRVSGAVTPAEQISSVQKYDIDGIISATSIERL